MNIFPVLSKDQSNYTIIIIVITAATATTGISGFLKGGNNYGYTYQLGDKGYQLNRWVMQRFETSAHKPFYGHYTPNADWLLDVISGGQSHRLELKCPGSIW